MPRKVQIIHNNLAIQIDKNDLWRRKNPNICPVCHEEEIEYQGHIDYDGALAYQSANCLICESHWEDEYKLQGITSIYEHKKESGKVIERTHVDCTIPQQYEENQ